MVSTISMEVSRRTSIVPITAISTTPLFDFNFPSRRLRYLSRNKASFITSNSSSGLKEGACITDFAVGFILHVTITNFPLFQLHLLTTSQSINQLLPSLYSHCVNLPSLGTLPAPSSHSLLRNRCRRYHIIRC